MKVDGTTSLVVINYNNARFVERCLDSLSKATGILEVIVVDDGSTDNSVELIKKHPVKLIEHGSNIGPVKARNIGANAATGDYLLFLDMDATLAPDYITRGAQFFAEHPDAGVVSGKILDGGKRMWFNFGYDPDLFRDRMQTRFDNLFLKADGKKWLQSIIAFFAYPFSLNFVSDTIRKVDWVVEMALMTRRSVFEKVGGFDEKLFMFFEGPDYCRQVRAIGYAVYYLPEIVCNHLGGHSHTATRDNIFMESRNYYLKKYSV